jgi:cell cycle serine/threonine-protein kinase CDC5/MSD2
VVDLQRIYENGSSVILLFSLYEGGSLSCVLKKYRKLSERDAKSICIQLLLTSDFFQRNKVIHRDLKLGNVLLWSN